MRKMVALALKGHPVALRLALERLVAPLKAIDEQIEKLALSGTLTDQGAAIAGAVAAGVVSPIRA